MTTLSKEVKVKYDDIKIVLSKGYIRAIKSLLKQDILMMRKVYKDSPECWIIGVANIEDIALSKGVSLMFGSKEDKSWLKKQGQIFIEVPLKNKLNATK